MIGPAVGFAFEGLKLYVVLGFLAWVMAIPHAIAHWAFAVLISLACMPGLMARVSRSRTG